MFKITPVCALMFLLFTSCVQIPAAVERPAGPDGLIDQADDLQRDPPEMSISQEEDLYDGRAPDLEPGPPQDMASRPLEDLWSGRPADAKPGPVQDMSEDQSGGVDMRLNDGRGEL